MLYVLAGTTGLRRKELLNLSWDDITLSADNAFVRVKASIAKNGKEARTAHTPRYGCHFTSPESPYKAKRYR